MSTHKKCPTCQTEKEVSEFHKSKRNKDGLNSQCKECRKQYHQDNRDAIAAYGKQYYEDNKSLVLEKCKTYRDDNKEAIQANARRYYEVNREAKLEYSGAYRRDRYANDPAYALLARHRARVTLALDGKGKAESSIELLGCTPAQYRHHIEAQFVENMGWNQRGLWHVDHYHPLAAFDMTLKKHQKYAFHWSNCRPMWAEDNLKKSDKHCPDELKEYLKSKLPKYEDVYTL